jgi:riboflavin biosynthesis pyrimidine reductase
MSQFFTMDFPKDKIKLTSCMENKELLTEIKANSPEKKVPQKVLDVYGEVYFPKAPDHRPYTYGSFVLSMDGKIGFPDNAQGPLISSKNLLDQDGGLADFWVLNMLRAYADGVIIGAKTLQAEENMTSHVFDQSLAEARIEDLGKKTIAPWNIIVSFDGTDIPLNHMIFDVDGLDVFIATSPQGGLYLDQHFNKDHQVFGPYASEEEVDIDAIKAYISKNREAVPIFATGEGTNPDSQILLWILRKIGVERLIIESPSYTWHLADNAALDEAFLNYSSVFVGGNISMGGYQAFSYEKHPHSHILMLFHHQSNFIYTRQKLVYGLEG